MNGKIIKIANNDLYGNVDNRSVSLFACFIYKKYMNRYCIFSFKDEYNKNILYYGSIHTNANSVIVFEIGDKEKKYIDKFIEQYVNKNINSQEFEFIDISNINKIELVSYNNMSFNKLNELDKLSIKSAAKVIDNNNKEKKPIFLYIVLVVLILLSIGLTYFYFRPNDFMTELNMLVCTNEGYNDNIKMKYNTELNEYFDKHDKVKKIDKVDIYKFNGIESYNEFKNNSLEQKYFKIDGTFKYDDEKFELRIIYKDSGIYIVDNYSELKEYLKHEGYNCREDKYYE